MIEGEGLRYEPHRRNEYVSRLVYLLNRYGVGESEALEWLLAEYADYNAANGSPLSAMVRSVYANHRDEHATMKPPRGGRGGKGDDGGGCRRANIAEMELFITESYRLRANTVSNTAEWAPLAADGTVCGEFREIDDCFENSLWREMRHAGINTDLMTLTTLLRSDFVRPFHPLAHYLDGLPPWDGHTDHIGSLLALVHCRSVTAEEFDRYARRWLVAMVAAGLYDNVVNHEILVLLGRQGTYKSSFMNNILPPCLRRYYSVKTNSHRMDKDDAFALTENFLINFEEIDSMQRTELNQLKALTTVPYIKDRPAYGRRKVRLPHRASFCATGNNLQFLTDDTGNRRWLVFEVESIDNPWEAGIDHDGVYAQARALIDGGFKYWFDSEEIGDINRHNREFETPDSARELVVTHFRRPARLESCLYLTSTQIAARFAPQLRVSPVAVGRVMRELEYEQVRNHYSKFWKVVEIQLSDVGKNLPGGMPKEEKIPF
ncbi:MAG: virulence-associated E family protein [Clostridium sp.]|nr:virulence-associated E family protein [Clostridium sp.]